MTDLGPLLDGDAAGVSHAVRSGEVDLGELAQAIVARVELAPPAALLAVDPDAVRAQVDELGRRLADGEELPLAGVPVAHKDLLDTERFPTTCGNPAFARPSERDATAVARTVAAGAIQVGKANMHELAYGVTGLNAHTGDVVNPRAPDRMPGGSSSGSAAAVASGAVMLSLGTDTGGSVRIPASACGVVGCKTTLGAVPTTGVQPLSWLQDTVGPIARTAGDAALLLRVVAGPDGQDPVAQPPPDRWQHVVFAGAEGLTVVLPTPLWEHRIDPDVAGRCREAVVALEEAGASVQEVDLDGVGDARRAQGVLLAAHALAVHRERFEREPDAFGDDIRARLEASRSLTAVDVVEALRERDRWRSRIDDLLPSGTIAVTPTLAMPPPHLDDTVVQWPDGDEDVTPALTRLTSIWNLAATPAVSVPVRPMEDGAPVGLQLIGRWWSEPVLLSVAGGGLGSQRS